MFVKQLRGFLLHRESVSPTVSRGVVDFSDPSDSMCSIGISTDGIEQERVRWERENLKAVEYLDKLRGTVNIRRLATEARARRSTLRARATDSDREPAWLNRSGRSYVRVPHPRRTSEMAVLTGVGLQIYRGDVQLRLGGVIAGLSRRRPRVRVPTAAGLAAKREGARVRHVEVCAGVHARSDVLHEPWRLVSDRDEHQLTTNTLVALKRQVVSL